MKYRILCFAGRSLIGGFFDIRGHKINHLHFFFVTLRPEADMRLSILMPTYNGMKYLAQAVDSVLSQNYQDWELVVSDDGSTDGTRDFLSGIKDPRIKIHLQPKNLNIFGNLNFLFSQAKGEISQILCQDDYFLAKYSLNRILQQWSALSPDIAYLRMNHTSETNKGLARYEGRALPPVVSPEESDLLFFIFGCIPGNLSNISVRTSAVQDVGWFRTDLPYAGDFEFWSRLGNSRSWALSSDKVLQVRSHAGQASRTLNPRGELIPQVCVVLGSLYPRLVARGYSPMLLRLIATLNYVSLQRYMGIKALLRGGGDAYLKSVSAGFDRSDFSFGPLLGWATFFVSLGGRILLIPVAKQLLNRNRAQLADPA
jgi:glycosyltransferase involved in cell wall biosynthesis